MAKTSKPRRYTTTIVIRLEASDVARLDAEAERTRVPRAILVRNLIDDGLNARDGVRETAPRLPVTLLTAEEWAVLRDYHDRNPIARRA